jgi:hypothetical protein
MILDGVLSEPEIIVQLMQLTLLVGDLTFFSTLLAKMDRVDSGAYVASWNTQNGKHVIAQSLGRCGRTKNEWVQGKGGGMTSAEKSNQKKVRDMTAGEKWGIMRLPIISSLAIDDLVDDHHLAGWITCSKSKY